jgi:hypothetical protein
LVPSSDEADSLQGELLRSIRGVGDARSKGEWDIGNDDEIEILRRHLPDPRVFSDSEQSAILAALGRMAGSVAFEEIAIVADHVVRFCETITDPILKPVDENWLEYGT